MKKKDRTGELILLVLIGVPVLYSCYFLFLYHGFTTAVDQGGALTGVRSGTFGDAFGTLNALFSGMAFAGVMMTLLLQRKDLTASHEQISKQQAESQFYNLLSLQQQLIQGFDLQRLGLNPYTINGRDCFKDWQRKMKARYAEFCVQSPEKPDVVLGIAAYQRVFSSHQGDLGLYFRSLYSVFRFIEGVDSGDKKHFGNVVRSLLSDYELVLLFYNCLSKQGHNFMRYANAYALFDNLDVRLLLSRAHVVHLERAALGSNPEALGAWKEERKKLR